VKKFWMIAVLLSLILESQAQPDPKIELEACHVRKHSQEVLCGTYTVYENRTTAQGRQIDIHLAVIPAIDENVEPDPIVVFAGGPGQSAIEMVSFVRSVFSEVNERRDLVLIDQRGMGSSAPLDCEIPEEDFLNLDTQEQEHRAREILQECLEKLDADATLYTQDLANLDIHEILLALGYERVNLYGGSWGTRSALLYAHQFPEQVRTIVLDGNLPLSNKAPSNAAADGERALRALFTDCADDPRCHQAFPRLEEDYRTAASLLGPDGASVTMDNPTTGEELTFVLTPNGFGDVLRSVLYSPELSRIIPLIIHQASQGDYRALQGVGSFLSTAFEGGMTLGASLTIFCSEEFSRLEAGQPEQEIESGLLGDQLFSGIQNGCRVWPKAPLPAIYTEDVGSEAPALLLSGELDPITPPHWGEEMAKALPNSLHLVATGTGHNVAPFGCAAELIDQFIDQGHLEGIDGHCLTELTRPSFFVHASGPSNQKPTTEGGEQ
jgi:pimeloyl-ACP methyl ester carboxylesterase